MNFLLNFIWLPIISVIRFDRQFYNNAYSDIEGRNLGIVHFLRKGILLGYQPCEGLDPILFRLKPVKYCMSFFLGFLDCDYSLLSANLGSLKHYKMHSGGINPEKVFHYRKFYLNSWIAEVKQNTTLTYKDNTLELKYLNFSVLENALVKNLPFALVRIPHGFWDHVCLVESLVLQLSKTNLFARLSNQELWLLATRFMRGKQHRIGVYAESFFELILNDIENIPKTRSFYFSLSLKGFPTFSDSPLHLYGKKHEIDRRCAWIFNALERGSYSQSVYDATIMKKWLITGDLRKLPGLLKHKKVTLIGPGILQNLGQKWGLDEFVHIEIPNSNTHNIRYQVLESIEHECKSSDKPQVFLFQCGATLALWFILRLHSKYPENIYIDMGQSINAWYYDSETDSTNRLWYNIYRDHINKVCGFQETHSHNIKL